MSPDRIAAPDPNEEANRDANRDPNGNPGADSRRDGGILRRRHGSGFVSAWGAIYRAAYRWRREGRFTLVPSLLGSPVLSYLPGLDHSDLGVDEARALSRELAGRRHFLRVLGAPAREQSLAPGSPVVMRLDLSGCGSDPKAPWRRLRPRTRGALRRAAARYAVSEEDGTEGFAAFRAMLRLALDRNGAPLPPAHLHRALVSELGGRILVVRDRARGEVAAAALWFRDGPLAWTPLGGARRAPERPGHRAFWALVETAAADGAQVLDFGGSAFGGGSYRFKRQFGAAPVPVLFLSDRPGDRRRRHAPARRLWRALPRGVTGRLGPLLCRYLAEY